MIRHTETLRPDTEPEKAPAGGHRVEHSRATRTQMGKVRVRVHVRWRDPVRSSSECLLWSEQEETGRPS